jgi:hypothetical protein
MCTKCIEKTITRNLRNLHKENPVKGDESELTKIGRILHLLSGLLSFRGDQIILHHRSEESDTVMTFKEAIIYLHTKVYPVLAKLIESAGLFERDLVEMPCSYTCIYHLQQYMKNTDDTKRFLRVAKEFFAEETA